MVIFQYYSIDEGFWFLPVDTTLYVMEQSGVLHYPREFRLRTERKLLFNANAVGTFLKVHDLANYTSAKVELLLVLKVLQLCFSLFALSRYLHPEHHVERRTEGCKQKGLLLMVVMPQWGCCTHTSICGT